ncbi:DNA-directed RNA polymerase subunit beta [Candidatus Microgenomates bacterium]|nr:DNA-directed RNA polymerase subunit beta [Candidatus Microgenomates bacterium]
MIKTKNSSFAKRLFWGKTPKNLIEPNLIIMQLESYQWFLEEGLKQILSQISPVEDFTGKNWILNFGELLFGKPKYTSEEALDKGVTYDFPLKVEATLVNKKTGKKASQEVFLGDIPQMTVRGTFIINGVERCIVNQIIRSPGVFFTGELDPASGRIFYNAELRPLHGSWLDFSMSRNNILSARIDKRRKFPATVLLRAMGIGGDKELLELFKKNDVHPQYQFISSTIEKDSTNSSEEGAMEVFRKMRPGEPVVLDNAREFFSNMFSNTKRYQLGKVGRFKINQKLGLAIPNTKENWVLKKEDIIGTIAYLIDLVNGKGKVDDIDHLSNRRVRRVGEIVSDTVFRTGALRLERSIKERMSMAGTEVELIPSQVVNARPIIAVINNFFRTSRLSSILDQNNPLSELDNLRRLTVMGPGGISRERAAFSIRDINSSQYGRICPIRSPEGPNIGLVTYLALFTRINEYGFLEAPYRKIKKIKKGKKVKVKITDEVVYLSADEEEKYHITHAGVKIDQEDYIIQERIPVRHQGDFFEVSTDMVDFIDLIPRQVVGASASLIPFLAHDEANRALMGTHMQCQAVPLLLPESPIIGTGMEEQIAKAMGWVRKAKVDGKVTFVDAEKIIIKEKNKEVVYPIQKFRRTSQSTCYSQKPVVSPGQKIKKDQLIIDGPACDNGEIALGQNLLIAYMSFEGLGYEDAIVVSDKLVKDDLLTSINIEEYDASVVDTKLGPEETTRDIPNVGEESLANLDKEGIIVVGSEVGPNDILVGKIAPKGETELTAEERLLRAIFGEKAREVRDTSLRIPHGERGTVVDIKILDREKGDELEPGTLRKIIVKVAQIRKVVVGDKVAGRHGNKGVISKIVPQADMPYLSDGTPIDIIISPISVLSRMNLGQLLETHLGWAGLKLGEKYALPVFEKIKEERITKELQKAGLPVDGKAILYNGKTGLPFKNEIVVGIEYIMKLIHMVEDKTHARSTGPYSLVTQQPLGGKAQMGGQRLGEMEVWALEAHQAAYILQEMLTTKSDDVIGRARAFEAIVKGKDIPAPTIPESFKVLVKELQALSLDVFPTGVITKGERLFLKEKEAEETQKTEEKTEGKTEKLVKTSVKEVSQEDNEQEKDKNNKKKKKKEKKND